MIKKIQRKLTLVITGIIGVVFFIIASVIIFSSIDNERQEARRYLENLSMDNNNNNNNNFNKDKEPPKKFMEHRSFVITLDENLNPTNFDFQEEFFSYEYLLEFEKSITSSKKFKDNLFSSKDNIYYLIKTTNTGNYLLLGIDFSMEHSFLLQNIVVTISSFVLGIVILSFIVWLLSFWIIRPIQDSFIKQKQFISDASHELKTPLTIINANVDVLKTDLKNSEWLNNIESQTKRMNTLVNDMLTLAKLEEVSKPEKIEFDLGKAILNIALPFEAVCFEKNKEYEVNVEPNIKYLGNEEAIKKIAGILIDNAIKHSIKNAIIKVDLKQENNTTYLSVYNTGCEILNTERNKIFERFYRKDLSRNQETGGSGLGLAIVKDICDKEKWKIIVDSNLNEFMEIKILF